MNEEIERGRFEGEAIARLEALREMGGDIKSCLEKLKQRVDHLEHQETRLKTFAAMCGTVAACFVGVVIKIVFK